MPTSVRWIPGLLLLGATSLAPALGQERAADPGPGGQQLAISSDLRVVVHSGRDIELQVLPRAGDAYADLSRRLTGRPSHAKAIRSWNGHVAVSTDLWVRVPLALLSDDYRALVLLSLFPQDGPQGEDWIHVVRAGRLATYGEGLWEVAEWFTGDGDNFPRIQQANGLRSPELRPAQRIRIGAALLHPAFRSRPRSDDGSLEYGKDAQGPFAGYRLRQGEALYSAVVVRFTGRNSAEDVTGLAQELCGRSGIVDPRDIPAGYLIKIPFDYLEPEYLPREHPRRLEAEAARREMDRALAREPVKETRGGLRGVLVMLDPGHGGRDLGTSNNGIWEHDYIYDVACRLRQKLERQTAARVVMTLEDLETGCEPSAGDKLKANRQGTILTHPPFLAKDEDEHRIGVNLRWYLANSVYRKALADGTTADRVVFLSLHADSRHRSLRGAMVYVPGTKYRSKTYGHNNKTYRRYREVRERPEVRFPYKQRVRSEAVSRELAHSILSAFRGKKLPVQDHQPVRDRVIRGKRVWVPAVIRNNAIPSKVLVELVNLNNRKDAALLSSAAQRERMADALQEALFSHFGEPMVASR